MGGVAPITTFVISEIWGVGSGLHNFLPIVGKILFKPRLHNHLDNFVLAALAGARAGNALLRGMETVDDFDDFNDLDDKLGSRL